VQPEQDHRQAHAEGNPRREQDQVTTGHLTVLLTVYSPPGGDAAPVKLTW
jgi:hypothetical protein